MGNQNQTIVLFIIGTGILSVLVAFVIFTVMLYRRSKVLHFNEVTRIRLLHEQEMLKAMLEIREESMQSIAREVHDNIGQLLSLAILNISVLRKEQPDSDKIAAIHNTITQAAADLRHIIKIIKGEVSETQPLQALLKTQTELINRIGSGVKATLAVSGKDFALPLEQKTILFRIVQEAINNAIKYASAEEINIALHSSAKLLTLTVADNGKGFNVADIGAGNGINNMKYRAGILGGTCAVSSSPQGTIVTLSLLNE